MTPIYNSYNVTIVIVENRLFQLPDKINKVHTMDFATRMLHPGGFQNFQLTQSTCVISSALSPFLSRPLSIACTRNNDAYPQRSSVRPNLKTREPAKMKAFCINRLTPDHVCLSAAFILFANSTQQEAMSDANPTTKPKNSHSRDPRGPIQPPVYVSPRTCALDTEFTMINDSVAITPQTCDAGGSSWGYTDTASMMNHHPEKNKIPAASEAIMFLFSPLSNHTQLGIVMFSKQLIVKLEIFMFFSLFSKLIPRKS